MVNFSLRLFIIRILIIFFWLILFGAFFVSSRFTNYSSDNTLYVFTWPGILDPVYIQKFEKMSGVRVKTSYYESNQELLVKLKATGGSGYDLIIPSDYAVNILRKESLLEPLDKKRLVFLDRLQPSLLNNYYDPGNIYSIPFDWGIYGIGIDKTQYPSGIPEASWQLIFEPSDKSKPLGMVNDPYEAFTLAKQYLYGNKKTVSVQEIEKLTELLKKQHSFVSIYTDARADYLLATHNCALVLSASSYMWRGMKKYPYIHFMIPKEGTILTIENCVIPKASKNKKKVYEFLNFIYSKESIEHHFNYSAFLPATTDAQHWTHLPEEKRKLLVPTPTEFKKFHFLQELMPEQQLYELWITVKS